MAEPKNKDHPRQDAASSVPGAAAKTTVVVATADGREIRVCPDQPRAAQIAELLRFS